MLALSNTQRPPSIADVASLAGVSHQTVSRVLNNHPSVRQITRARVLAAIDQLGYRPNTAARALASGRSKTLGVVALDTTLYGPASTLYGIQQAAQHEGYFVSVMAVHSLDRPSVGEAVRRLTSQAVEGLAVIAPFTSAHEALAYLPIGTPVVAVEGDPEGDVAVVTVDQAAGARLATQHLLAAGYDTVFHVAGPAEWQEAGGRTAGWRATLEEAGADVTPPLYGDWSARSGYDAGQVLAQIPDARAIFVANDHMALGRPAGLARAGPPGPRGCVRGRLRRHPGIGLLHSPAHHRAPGFPAGGPGRRPAPGRPAHVGDQEAGPGADRPRAGVPEVELDHLVELTINRA